jgi:hypothetical protein
MQTKIFTNRKTLLSLSTMCAVILGASPVIAQDTTGEPGRSSGKPNPLKNVYFGEQHIHSANSPDAFAIGTRGTWDDIYNYAKGKPTKLSTTGKTIQKKTPYDFVGITDHAEYYGVMPRLIDPKDPLSKSALGKELQHPTVPNSSPKAAVNQILASILESKGMPEFITPDIMKENWANFVETANKHNEPGVFTAFLSFEWTSIPNGENMHRNVFFRDDQGPVIPYSSFDSNKPQDLWTYQEIQRNAGHDNLSIPHNGNVSNGWMYSRDKFHGGPMDERYARRRMLNEPLTEIIQTKGSSDTHPALSPNDEFASFEIFPNMINAGTPSQIRYGYVRQALADGMRWADELGGVNPLKYGIVSGADSHSAYSNNEEWGFNGSHGLADDTPEKRLSPLPNPSGDVGTAVGSAGATAVWAEENTRESLFDNMRNKETYGTSGPLIRLRFFGGWNFDKNLHKDDDFVKTAYANGVPMGGDLPDMPKNVKAPTFTVWALKDPDSGNLDRVQIIKVFSTRFNNPTEKIYEVALSDNRKVDPKTGKAPAVGNTVDVTKATYTNSIGDSELSATWTDPDFDPNQSAAYYVRVLEIPTPRWSTYDAVRNNLPLSEHAPATIQERAWSSPIWYTPASK